MPRWKLFYHVVWSTKNRYPLISQESEAEIHGLLRRKAEGLGAMVFALNGMQDHVHMVVSIPPKISLAKFIGQVKASTSAIFNKKGLEKLAWQEEYGVFSMDEERLAICVAYVEGQKRHHSENSTIEKFESMPKLPP